MPTTSDPVPGHHEKVVTGIYIARGNDTLGPYNSLEAAALVVGGYLRPDDFAACNGDPNWVSLANFLPLSAVPSASGPAPLPAEPAVKAFPGRWRPWLAAGAILLIASLLAVAGVRWLQLPRIDPHADVAPAPGGEHTPGAASPLSAQILPAPREAEPPQTAGGPLTGSISLALPGGGRVPLAGVRVSAYPVAALEPALGQQTLEAQAARARLDPQIEAAAGERVVRVSEAQAALKVLHEADPADPLIASLRFADQGAKVAAKTAEDDYRYLVDERTTAAGGEVYFRGLPAPAATTDTDAQGSFTLVIPSGDAPYAVAASARGTADDGSVRMRYWLLRLSPAQRAGRESLRLDDGNVSAAAAAESLIHTAD